MTYWEDPYWEAILFPTRGTSDGIVRREIKFETKQRNAIFVKCMTLREKMEKTLQTKLVQLRITMGRTQKILDAPKVRSYRTP